MGNKGIYLWYRKIRQKSPSGQIVALLTIIIAIIFLFVAITINIGKVSGTKTATNIAADGAGLTLASGLGSFGHYLSEEFLKGKTSKCDFNILGFISFIIFVASLVVFLTTGNMTAFLWSLRMMGTGALGMFTMNAIVFPHQAHIFGRLMAELTAEQSFQESAIQYTLFATANDPEMIVDINDYDEDGRTDDKISRFSAWYTWRLYIKAKENDILKRAINELRQKLSGFYLDCRVMRRYISGDADWPESPVGVFIDLLQDIDGKIDENEYEIGIVYDFIPQDSWDTYGVSGDVYDLKLKLLEEKTKDDNIWYDFTFWTDGIAPDDEDDPVNDEVDFFLSTLQDFKQWCRIPRQPPGGRGGRPGRDDDDNEEPDKGFLQLSINELLVGVHYWYPQLEEWVEETLYSWQKAEGPLDNWKAELLNRNDTQFNGSLLNDIDNTITYLENQLENDQNLYHGGLKTILEGRKDELTQEEKKHLEDLIKALDDTKGILKNIGWEERAVYDPESYQRNIYYADYQIERWQNKYDEFLVEWNKFKNIYETREKKNYAEYEWKDSLGEHTVRVDVAINPTYPTDDDTKLPVIRTHTQTLGFQKCHKLKNYQGSVNIAVTRTDPQEKDVNLAQRLLWRFRSPTVRSTAQVHYGIGPNDIYIMR